jgi:hypothetical protein
VDHDDGQVVGALQRAQVGQDAPLRHCGFALISLFFFSDAARARFVFR